MSGRSMTSGLRHHGDVAVFPGQTNPQRALSPRLAVPSGIQRGVAQEFAILGDDEHVKIGHQDDDALVSMSPTHADVVELPAIAKRH